MKPKRAWMRCSRSSALVGEPPASWRYALVEELADVVSGGTPPRGVDRYWGGSIPWATPTEVSGEDIRYLDSTRESITNAGLAAAGLRILPRGSVLVTTRATIGATAKVRTPMTTNQGFQSLVPRAGTDPAWLFHAMAAARPTLRRLAAGSTFKEVSRDSFRAFKLLVPTPEEQRNIAIALDAIDDAIERAQTVIASTKSLRNALLHDLLTRGVPGWHTQWRPVKGIGMLPATWDVSTLAALGRWTAGGTPSKIRKDFWQGTIPWVSPKDMKVPELWDTVNHVSDAAAAGGSTVVGPGAILVVVRGMILAHSFPIAIVRVRCAFNQDIRALTCAPHVIPSYALLALEHQRRALIGLATPSTHGTMRVVMDSMLSRPVGIPPLAEQARIGDALASADQMLRQQQLHLTRFRVLKSAAAEALLNGKIRASVDGCGSVTAAHATEAAPSAKARSKTKNVD